MSLARATPPSSSSPLPPSLSGERASLPHLALSPVVPAHHLPPGLFTSSLPTVPALHTPASTSTPISCESSPSYLTSPHCEGVRSTRVEPSVRRCGAPWSFHFGRLRAYDGKDKSRPLLLAIKGRVLNVSSGEDFYGVDGPYNIMAGKDARSGRFGIKPFHVAIRLLFYVIPIPLPSRPLPSAVRRLQ